MSMSLIEFTATLVGFGYDLKSADNAIELSWRGTQLPSITFNADGAAWGLQQPRKLQDLLRQILGWFTRLEVEPSGLRTEIPAFGLPLKLTRPDSASLKAFIDLDYSYTVHNHTVRVYAEPSKTFPDGKPMPQFTPVHALTISTNSWTPFRKSVVNALQHSSLCESEILRRFS